MTKKIQYTDSVLFVTDQLPLDAKLYFKDLDEMADLGRNNERAFLYYPGMLAIDGSTGQLYVWKEWNTDDETEYVLEFGFTYPKGYKKHDIDYSEKTFNFVKLTSCVASDINSNWVYNEIHEIQEDTTTIYLNDPGNRGIADPMVYKNGLRLAVNIDFTYTENSITFSETLVIGDVIIVDYRKLV